MLVGVSREKRREEGRQGVAGTQQGDGGRGKGKSKRNEEDDRRCYAGGRGGGSSQGTRRRFFTRDEEPQDPYVLELLTPGR